MKNPNYHYKVMAASAQHEVAKKIHLLNIRHVLMKNTPDHERAGLIRLHEHRQERKYQP